MSYNIWVINFKDGKQATMLSHECESEREANEASVERFGAKFSHVSKVSRASSLIGEANKNYNKDSARGVL